MQTGEEYSRAVIKLKEEGYRHLRLAEEMTELGVAEQRVVVQAAV